MIVIVEDERIQRDEIVRRLKEDMGFDDVKDFYCAEDAMENFPPDTTLVISDIGLPGMSGIQFAERIKETHPAITIFLCTATKVPECKSADAMFSKIRDEDKLWGAIEDFLKR